MALCSNLALIMGLFYPLAAVDADPGTKFGPDPDRVPDPDPAITLDHIAELRLDSNVSWVQLKPCACRAVVPEPLSVTAQSLIARDATDPQRVRRLTRLLLRLGCILAVGAAAVPAARQCGAAQLRTSDGSGTGVTALKRPYLLLHLLCEAGSA
jgi:hypothetical protein